MRSGRGDRAGAAPGPTESVERPGRGCASGPSIPVWATAARRAAGRRRRPPTMPTAPSRSVCRNCWWRGPLTAKARDHGRVRATTSAEPPEPARRHRPSPNGAPDQPAEPHGRATTRWCARVRQAKRPSAPRARATTWPSPRTAPAGGRPRPAGYARCRGRGRRSGTARPGRDSHFPRGGRAAAIAARRPGSSAVTGPRCRHEIFPLASTRTVIGTPGAGKSWVMRSSGSRRIV